MKKQLYRLAVLLLTMSMSACVKEHYLKFDTEYTGIYFTTDSTEYSFSVTPVEIREHLIKIPVYVMGAPADINRDINFELTEALTTAIDGMHYVIDKAIVPADSIVGYIEVRVLRDELKGNYSEGYERYKINLRLLENEYFVPTLDSLSQVHLCKFDNAIEQPNWYHPDYPENKIWLKGSLGVWHPYKLIKMVEYFHALESIQPLTYKKIAAEFGENLEHIPEGNPHKYGTIFKQYIYKPMYDHFNDPANEEMIRSMYPDFPFGDFPNPYPNS